MARHPLLRKIFGFQYSIPVNIYSKRAGGGHVQNTDYAMRVLKPNKTFRYELKGRGDMDAAKLGELSSDGKFNVFEPEYGTFVPMILNTNIGALEPVDSDDRAFVAQNMNESKQLYKNPKNLTNILQMMIPLVFMGMLIIGGLLMFKTISDGVAAVQGQNVQITQQQNQMLNYLQAYANKSGATTPTEHGNYTW